jgi:6-phosphogluconolactonase (cycloisomerase 2 family)
MRSCVSAKLMGSDGGVVSVLRSISLGCVAVLLSVSWLGCGGNGGGGTGRTVGGGSGTTSFLLVTDATANKVLSSSISTSGSLASTGSGTTETQPTGIAVASNKFVLAANTATTTVNSFTLSTSGALTANGNGAFAAGLNPVSIIMAPTGDKLVVANSGSNSLSVQAIDTAGNLTQLNSLGITATPRSMIFVGTTFYVSTTNGIFGYQIINNIITPLALAGASGTNYSALASTNGVLYAADDTANVVRRYSIDSTTGALTLVGTATPTGTAPVAMLFDSTSTYLYVVNRGSGNVSQFVRDSTGALSSIGTITTGGNLPTAIALDSVNLFMFVPNSGSGTVAVFKPSSANGTLAAVGTPVSMGTQPVGVAVATP